MTDIRFYSLLCAIVLYALLGTPTPDTAGFVELIVALLLVLAAGVGGTLSALSPYGPAWHLAGWALLVYGLSVPVTAGLFSGHGTGLMLRDMIPFLFMLMPLFYASLISARPHYRNHLAAAVTFAGVAFAARTAAPYILDNANFSDPSFMANAPTVLFAALFLCGLAGLSLYRSASLLAAAQAGFFAALAAIGFIAMALVMQRATLGYAALYLAALLCIGFVKSPRRIVLPAIALILVAVCLWPVFADTAQDLIHKSALVGFNMRGQEAAAVIASLDHSPLSVIFGKGWGAQFSSPAVGGVTVNFTHSLLTSFWLKTGLCGALLALVYLVATAAALARLFLCNPLKAMALAGPFFIASLLYASFKSLDFGLILLVIATAAPAAAPGVLVARKAPVV